MNVYQSAVKWIKENWVVQGTEEELQFMREKAKTTHYCQECLKTQKPFVHLLASIFCNKKNDGISQKITFKDSITDICPDSWTHLVNLSAKWSEELENLKKEGKIQ